MRKIFKNKVFLNFGIAITGIALIIVSILTFYGNNVGNFVMSVDEELKDMNIFLSSTKDFTNPTSILQADAVRDARDLTYSMLSKEEAMNTDGSYIDPYFKYVAYTFYVKNFGSESIECRYGIYINSLRGKVDKAIRVMVITDVDDVINEKIYMAADSIEHEYVDIPPCIDFLSDKVIMEDKISGFFPNQTLKFTVLMWLEGQDPDTTAEILGGQIKIQMKFRAVNTVE